MGLISGVHDTVESLLRAVLEPEEAAPSHHLYTRYWDPRVAEYEAAFAEAISVQGAVAFNSGMAAVASLRELRQWGHKYRLSISAALYGTTTKLLGPSAAGDPFDPVRPGDLHGTDVFVESLANTFEMPMADLDAIFQATAPDALVVVDNTLLTPALFDVMSGAQRYACGNRVLVVESATKHLQAGADQVTAGIVYGDNEELLTSLCTVRQRLGTHLQPSCVPSLVIPNDQFAERMVAHSSNALQLAKDLQNHRAVAAIRYPGLRRDLDFSGGVLYFLLKGGPEAVVKFCNASACQISTSFGFDDTRMLPLGALPESVTGKAPSGQVRVSVGIERPFTSVVEKIRRALDALV